MDMVEDHLVAKLIFIIFLNFMNCLLGDDSKSHWNITNSIQNNCMLSRVKLNRETLHFIPYKITIEDFYIIFNKDKMAIDEQKYLDTQKRILHLKEECLNNSIFLIENYNKEIESKGFANYLFKYNENEANFELDYLLNYSFYKHGFPKGPIVYYTDSPRRVSSIFFGKPPEFYSKDDLEERYLERKVLFFCNESLNEKNILKIESRSDQKNKEYFIINNNC